MRLTDAILKLLDNYPTLKRDEDGGWLVVTSQRNVSPIKIHFSQKENTVEFRHWHWHFANGSEDEELLGLLKDILNNKSRMKETIVNGKVVVADLILSTEEILETGQIGLFKFFKMEKQTRTSSIVFS